jgi:hypothetical protein
MALRPHDSRSDASLADDPPPFIDGVKINSPHYLCKIILGPGSASKYTIVISQYEKSTTIYYTLRAYATCPFSLKKIGDPYRFQKQVTDEWRGPTAGGCPNHPLTHKNNPKFRLEIESGSNNQVFVELKGPKQYQLGVDVTILKVNDDSVTAPFRSKSSGAYRYKVFFIRFVVTDLFQVGICDIRSRKRTVRSAPNCTVHVSTCPRGALHSSGQVVGTDHINKSLNSRKLRHRNCRFYLYRFLSCTVKFQNKVFTTASENFER